MASRHEDWLRQAKRDLAHARHDATEEYYEWACFAAQQAAEKALKALYQRLGAEVRGHSVTGMLKELPAHLKPTSELLDRAKALDHHYIGPRYPNTVPEGSPGDYYTQAQANEAIQYAASIISFCEDHILSEGKGS